MVHLAKAKYGKDNVRVLRVVREGSFHHVVEYVVTLLLEGIIDTSYTQADNTVVVATDSMKNMVNYMAKTSPHVLQPELFALDIANLILSRYKHISDVHVDVVQNKWSRLQTSTSTKPHPHSFVQDGSDKRVISAIVSRASAEKESNNNNNKFILTKLTCGIKDLIVLKSTGSAFENFVRDEFTTLPEVDDRIFSTSIDCNYSLKLPTTNPNELANKIQFDNMFASVRKILIDTFANDESASVQATLYKMAQQMLKDNPLYMDHISIALPNKHYIPIDLSFVGVSNLKPADAEVFLPSLHPNGLITATISRDQSKL